MTRICSLLVTPIVLLAACTLTEAQEQAIVAAAVGACEALVPLTGLPAGVDALACKGSEGLLRLALEEAVAHTPAAPVAAPPEPARPLVHRRRRRLVGVVPARLAPMAQARLDATP